MSEKIFLNCSNHRSSVWSESQISAAEKYGRIVDCPFPTVSASDNEDEIEKTAETVAADIIKRNPSAVMCQGEFTLTFAIVKRLKEAGITVLAACSERIVQESVNDNGETEKSVRFEFERFRRYI